MKKIYCFLSVMLMSVLFQNCAHHRDVRPGTGGVNRVVTRESSAIDAQRSALSQAEHYCKEFNKFYEVVSEKAAYKGSMDEGTRNTIQQASNVASTLGFVTSDPGTHHKSPLSKAGVVGHSMTSGDDYESDIQFKCQ